VLAGKCEFALTASLLRTPVRPALLGTPLNPLDK
jgi:hypothetical protein